MLERKKFLKAYSGSYCGREAHDIYAFNAEQAMKNFRKYIEARRRMLNPNADRHYGRIQQSDLRVRRNAQADQ